MSRIGNNPVSFSEGTTVSLVDGIFNVKGKLGELSQKVDSSITFSINENEVVFFGKFGSALNLFTFIKSFFK